MPLLRIKKIDWLILKAFVPSFLLTYFVVVFLLLIQMIMSYLDEFVGKDIGAFTFSKMLYYFALSLTPMALPLAVLLSALMAYGNLGEHFELTAIKSAGVSLTRTLRPIGVFALLVSAVSFWFSNKVVPYANIKAYSTLYNVKQTKATLDLKEGIFYDGIPNYSIKVSKKYPDGKSLKNVIIYSHQDFRGNKDVVIADSGRMYTILDGAYLVMELFNGNAYSEHNDGTGQSNVKFIRNQYKKTKLVLSLAAFRKSNISDSLFRYHRLMKNVVELRREIDSFKREIVKAKEKSKFKLKLANQEIYNNGKTVWTYLKDANEVSISDYTPDDDSFVTPEKVIKLYKKDYKYVFIREFTENGKVYEEIDLQPTDRSKKVFKIRLVINKKTRSIKSWEIFEKNQNRSKYIINTIAYDVQVDDNYFNFDKRKYPNVNEVDLRD